MDQLLRTSHLRLNAIITLGQQTGQEINRRDKSTGIIMKRRSCCFLKKREEMTHKKSGNWTFDIFAKMSGSLFVFVLKKSQENGHYFSFDSNCFTEQVMVRSRRRFLS